eukprot:TRINITY_DN22692_c0_g1_i1.p1 TRINITY_DN22692_c0_g1~~TRINITY_DN22692_c0_g1_i1.p1  ORF type:complete len:115 (-),score=0.08 TRINITY_DN22692_c0_g1_i1:40-384(-)
MFIFVGWLCLLLVLLFLGAPLLLPVSVFYQLALIDGRWHYLFLISFFCIRFVELVYEIVRTTLIFLEALLRIQFVTCGTCDSYGIVQITIIVNVSCILEGYFVTGLSITFSLLS